MTKSNVKNIGKFGGLIAVLLFVIGLFVYNAGVFNRKYDLPVNRVQFPVIYTKDNTLNVKLLSKKPNTISDFLKADPMSSEKEKLFLSKNGEALYFLENYDSTTKSGSLFASFDGKNKIPVSSKAYQNIQVTDDGNGMLFNELPNLETTSGTLYLYKKNKEKQKIDDGVSINNYLFSNDAKYIGYLQTTESKTTGDFYLQKISGSKEKIDSNVKDIISITSFKSAVYTKDGASGNTELYYWNKSKGSVKVSDNITMPIYTSKLKDNIIFACYGTSATNRTLYSKENTGRISEIDNNVANILSCDSAYKNVIYTKDFSATDYSYDTYIKLGNKPPKKLLSSTSNATPILSSYDYSKISYISDINIENKTGNLYFKKMDGMKENEPILISDNVTSFNMSLDGKNIAYVKNTENGKHLYMYKNKTNTLVSENIEDDNYQFTKDNSALYYLANYTPEKGSGNLFMTKTTDKKSTSVKIDSDVSRGFYPRSYKQVIYTKDYNIENGESTLCLWKGNSKIERIDSGKIQVLFE